MGSPSSHGGYALGHSERELGRLSAQARVFAPFTRHMLQEAGVSEGMRILDVGSGAGDVAFLCASLVGPSGQVIGIDRAAAAVEIATQRARDASLENVAFLAGDPREISFEKPFDASVGRLVLMHHPDPVGTLRTLAGLLRPGGIIAFQEFDITGANSFPPAPTFEQCLEWIAATFARTGTDPRMGAKLYPAFLEAGLPAPTMSSQAGIWGGNDSTPGILVSDVIRSILPAMVKFGIATEAQVEIGTLADRVHQEILAGGGIATSPSLIGAWTKLS